MIVGTPRSRLPSAGGRGKTIVCPNGGAEVLDASRSSGDPLAQVTPSAGSAAAAPVSVGVVGSDEVAWGLARAFAARGRVLVFGLGPLVSGCEDARAGRTAETGVTGDLDWLSEPDALVVCVPV